MDRMRAGERGGDRRRRPRRSPRRRGRVRRLGRHRREVEALVAAAGDEHDVVEGARSPPTRRAAWWPWSRCTRRTPSRLADELDAVRRPGERGERGGDRVRSASPRLQHQRGRGQAVGEVVGQAAAQRARPAASSPAGPTSVSARDAVVGAARAERDVPAGRLGEAPHHHGVVGEADRRRRRGAGWRRCWPWRRRRCPSTGAS